ncbi:MAG TPA: hypothetical protein VFK07_00250 [Candidatus Paceibacterota bacterium]|nr:hypothetical protein [Candidatus Paceibacterota bacterium]
MIVGEIVPLDAGPIFVALSKTLQELLIEMARFILNFDSAHAVDEEGWDLVLTSILDLYICWCEGRHQGHTGRRFYIFLRAYCQAYYLGLQEIFEQHVIERARREKIKTAV